VDQAAVRLDWALGVDATSFHSLLAIAERLPILRTPRFALAAHLHQTLAGFFCTAAAQSRKKRGALFASHECLLCEGKAPFINWSPHLSARAGSDNA
jgi:hypothetical protein